MNLPTSVSAQPLDAVSIYDQSGLEHLWRELRLDLKTLRRLRIDYFKHSVPLAECINRSLGAHAEQLTNRIHDQALKIESRHDSEIDGATKIILRTSLGYLVESVILRASTGRTTLCVSSQVGCAAACQFCATGSMGIAKDLRSEEIVSQLAHANQILSTENRRVRNVVFMGMGEPLHNLEQVHQALRALTSPTLFHHPPQKILLSTVGVIDALVETCEEFPSVNYALSLHSASQRVRESIIPLASRYPVDYLRDAIVDLNRIQSGRTSVMIEYLMLDRINDSEDDAKQLVQWLSGLRVHLNLIPFNRVQGVVDLHPSPRDRIEAFARHMKAMKVPTTIRYSMGQDIEAACGQLVRKENKSIAKRLLQGNV